MRWVIYLAAALMLLSVTLAEQVSAKSPPEILEEETAMTYFSTPFVTIVDVAASRHNLKIQLMPDVDRYVPVTYDQQGKLKTVLNGLMEQMKLAYSVEEDGIVIHRPGKYRLLPIPVPAPDADPGLVKALDEEARFEFTGTPLATAMDRIMERHKIKIALAAGIEKYSGVTYDGRGPLKYELRSLLRPLELTYELTRDSILIRPIAPPQSSPEESSRLPGQIGPTSIDFPVTHRPASLETIVSPPAGEAALPAESRETVTYEFTARIKDNGGIYYFAPGTTISGRLTYDVAARRIPIPYVEKTYGRYLSSKNELVLDYRGQRFTGVGDTYLSVSVGYEEGIAFMAHNIRLPTGWYISDDHPSDAYGITLKNVPNRGVLRNIEIPRVLNLSQFAKPQLRLDFFPPMTYPQGKIEGRSTVLADIELLTPATSSADEEIVD